MLKMMTYGEANQVLGSSLTPTNRCLTKSVAIEAGAAEDPLASFTSNRLVPASVVQPGQSDVYENFFIDSNGNQVKSLTINVNPDEEVVVVKTVLYVNGVLDKDQILYQHYGGYRQDWIHDDIQDPNEIISYLQDIPRTFDSTTGILTSPIKLYKNVTEVGMYAIVPFCIYDLRDPSNYHYIHDDDINITINISEDPQPTTYTIRFLDHDGTVLKTQTVQEGDTPTAPNDPTRTDYNFTSWSPAISPATQDQDYTATYTQKPYRVTFRDDSQFGGGIITDHYYNAQENPVIPDAPQHTGYTHTGWIPQVGPVSSNATYYATYQGDQPQPTEYTIRFLDYDGTVLKTQQCESGTTPTAPIAPLRPGYTFIGWSPSITAATKNQDYTATYRQDGQDVYINIKITNSTGRTINVNGVYFTYSGGREAMYWYDNVDISNNRTYTKNNIQYYEEGSTISKIRVEYTTSSGEYQLVEIPTSDWHCPLVTELTDGDTLSITLWD